MAREEGPLDPGIAQFCMSQIQISVNVTDRLLVGLNSSYESCHTSSICKNSMYVDQTREGLGREDSTAALGTVRIQAIIGSFYMPPQV